MTNSDGGEGSTCEEAAGTAGTGDAPVTNALHDIAPDHIHHSALLRQSSSRSYILPPDDFRHNESCPEIGPGWTVDERKLSGLKAEPKTQNDLTVAASSSLSQKRDKLGDSSGDISCESNLCIGSTNLDLYFKSLRSLTIISVLCIDLSGKHPPDMDTKQVEPADAEDDAKIIAQTLLELSNATPSNATASDTHPIYYVANQREQGTKERSNEKSAPASKKRKGEDTDTGMTSKRKYKKSAAGNLKTGDNDKTDVAKMLIGMTKTGSSTSASAQASTESSAEAASKIKKQRGMSRSDATWNQRLAELRQFRELHGHTNVPQKYEKNPSLGAWVARNRLFMRKWEEDPTDCSSYQVERMEELKAVGLVSGIGK